VATGLKVVCKNNLLHANKTIVTKLDRNT